MDRGNTPPEPTESGRPRHPTKQAVWLLVGLTVLIVILAAISTARPY